MREMKVLSRLIAFVLVALVLVLAALNLAGLAVNFPVAYVGFLGPALLQTFWGFAFYAALGVGPWLFLRAGAALRAGLNAPRRDRTIAIVAGILGVPVLITLGSLLGRLLP
jgi:hypothetical protein